jgi:hypothetical protein
LYQALFVWFIGIQSVLFYIFISDIPVVHTYLNISYIALSYSLVSVTKPLLDTRTGKESAPSWQAGAQRYAFLVSKTIPDTAVSKAIAIIIPQTDFAYATKPHNPGAVKAAFLPTLPI